MPEFLYQCLHLWLAVDLSLVVRIWFYEGAATSLLSFIVDCWVFLVVQLPANFLDESRNNQFCLVWGLTPLAVVVLPVLRVIVLD